MGEFNDCGLWMKLTFLTSTIGFSLDLFGMAMGLGGNGGYGGKDANGLLVAGFLFFLGASSLLLVNVHVDEMKSSKIAGICFIVMAGLAGLLTIIGIADWRGRYGGDASFQPYSTMVGCIGSLLVILAAIFAVLELVGVKVGGGGGGGGGGKAAEPSSNAA